MVYHIRTTINIAYMPARFDNHSQLRAMLDKLNSENQRLLQLFQNSKTNLFGQKVRICKVKIFVDLH